MKPGQNDNLHGFLLSFQATHQFDAEQELRRSDLYARRAADFIEHCRTDKSLRDREERLQAVLNAATDAIVNIDQRGLITDVNPSTEKMFGYTRQELVGQNVKMLMPKPYCDEHDGYIAHYLETGEARIIDIGREVVGRRKDGSTFPVGLGVSRVDHLGLFTGVLRDMSALRETEKHVLRIADDEQRRIGQELHDGTGQELTGLSLFAGTIQEIIRGAVSREIEGRAIRLLEEVDFLRLEQTSERLSRGLAEANQHVHALTHGIMPVQIDTEGLRSALEELAAATDAQDNISCRFACSGPVEVSNNTTATHLYRIAQEAERSYKGPGIADHGLPSRYDRRRAPHRTSSTRWDVGKMPVLGGRR